MYKLEWNVIQKELSKCLSDGVGIRYGKQITNKFPEIRPIEGNETFYTDPDYDKNAVLSVSVGPFDIDDHENLKQCIEQVIAGLKALKYDALSNPYSSAVGNQAFGYIYFKKPLTDLYLFDEED